MIAGAKLRASWCWIAIATAFRRNLPVGRAEQAVDDL